MKKARSNYGRPNDRIEIEFSGTISGEQAHALVAHAEKRKRDPADVLLDIIDVVLRDNMIDAVLDDQP